MYICIREYMWASCARKTPYARVFAYIHSRDSSDTRVYIRAHRRDSVFAFRQVDEEKGLVISIERQLGHDLWAWHVQCLYRGHSRTCVRVYALIFKHDFEIRPASRVYICDYFEDAWRTCFIFTHAQNIQTDKENYKTKKDLLIAVSIVTCAKKRHEQTSIFGRTKIR